MSGSSRPKGTVTPSTATRPVVRVWHYHDNRSPWRYFGCDRVKDIALMADYMERKGFVLATHQHHAILICRDRPWRAARRRLSQLRRQLGHDVWARMLRAVIDHADP